MDPGGTCEITDHIIQRFQELYYFNHEAILQFIISRGSSPGYGGLVFLWSNFPSLMVDYYVQLGNLLLLITSPILI